MSTTASGSSAYGALSRSLGDYVSGTRFADLPAATVAAAKRSLLDGLGVKMAATTLGEGVAPFAALAQAEGGAAATLIGRGTRASLLGAALANGALAHAIDFEDSHDGAPVHPNAALLAAALAMAEARGPVSGERLLGALAIGCDLTCRLGLALQDDPARFGWYPPPILGGFGAVAACATLIGLTGAQTVDAFSLLLCSHTCSAELKYSPASHVRAVRDAFPAQAAVQAVLLAEQGVKGFDAPIEGKAGLFALYAAGRYSPDILLADLGRRFEGERLSFKLWPSCRGTHPFIEAAIRLRKEQGFAWQDVAAIRLTGHPIVRMLFEPIEQKRRPHTAIDAKFSLPFTVATAVIDGTVTLDSFTPAALARKEVAELAALVDVEIDPTAPADAIASGATAIELRNGRIWELDVRQPLGHPANPLSDEQLRDKFRACALHAQVPPPPAEIERLIAVISRIEERSDAGAALFREAIAA